MQRFSIPILATFFGLCGFLIGGPVGMFAYLWAVGELRSTGGAGVAGEFAAPYGFAGALIGLALGVWLGARMAERFRRGRKAE